MNKLMNKVDPHSTLGWLILWPALFFACFGSMFIFSFTSQPFYIGALIAGFGFMLLSYYLVQYKKMMNIPIFIFSLFGIGLFVIPQLLAK